MIDPDEYTVHRDEHLREPNDPDFGDGDVATEEDDRFARKIEEQDLDGDWALPRWMRLLDWLEEYTTGPGSWPWGQIWIWRGFSFHFANGLPSGFAIGFPLPRILPGFVRSYQVGGPRRFWLGQVCPWWRESDLHCIVPLFPPGLPSASRAMRLRGRNRG